MMHDEWPSKASQSYRHAPHKRRAPLGIRWASVRYSVGYGGQLRSRSRSEAGPAVLAAVAVGLTPGGSLVLSAAPLTECFLTQR